MTYISLDRFATALGMTENKQTDSHEFASVVRINEDGSYGVRFNGATEVTRAVRCCDADVGNRVFCVISNGQVTAIGRVGGSVQHAVLFDDDEGETGNLTLPQSAADFDNMRIFFKKSNGHYGYLSVDVYKPNGKRVSMTVFEPYHTEQVTWFASRTITVNGTAITTYDYANGSIGSSRTGGSNNEIAITRIEAW